MRLMKPILIALLLFATASLVLVVYSAKNRQGMFGKIYEDYILQQSASRARSVIDAMETMNREVQTLASDQTVRSVFVSTGLGESTLGQLDNFRKIVDALKDCRKIQVVDTAGRVIFSTVSAEINEQRIIPTVFRKMKDYFSANDYIYLPPVGQEEIVALYPVSDKTGSGFVAVYYAKKRLVRDGADKLSIPVIRDQYIFMTTAGKSVPGEDVSGIISHYASRPVSESTNKAPAAGAVVQYKGKTIVNYTKNEPFLPWQVILILVVNFVLLGAIVYALIRSARGDTVYKNIRLSSFDRELETPPVRSPAAFRAGGDDEIQELVTDIEDNRPYGEKAARKGIEDMILTSDVSVPEETPLEAAELSVGDDDSAGRDFRLSPSDLTLSEESFSGRSSTELFAEQDRILEGVDNRPFQESLDFEKPDAGFIGGTPEGTPELEIISPEMEVSSEDTSAIEAVEPPALEMAVPETPPVISEDEEFKIPSFGAVTETAQAVEPPQDTDLSATIPDVTESRDDFRISLDDEDMTLMARPEEEEIVLTADTGAGDERLDDITHREEMVPLEDLSQETQSPVLSEEPALPDSAGIGEDTLESETLDFAEALPESPPEITPPVPSPEESSLSETDAFTAEKVDAVVKLSPQEYEKKMRKVFVEPPVRLSKITSVQEYGKAAMDIAKSSLNIDKVLVLQKKGDTFQPVLNRGFDTASFRLDTADPVYQLFLREKKSLDITGHIRNTRYLKEKFSDKDIGEVEEFFIMPIINRESIEGIAMFARDRGTPAPTNFQRSELFNMGYLQEV